MYVQGYGKVVSYAEGKLFLVEELLLVIKLVLGGPGISGHHREGRKAMA